MTSRERILAAMQFRPVDRVPFMIIDGIPWLIEKNGMSFRDFFDLPDLGVELTCDTFAAVESDSVTAGLGCWGGWLEAIGCSIKMTDIGASIQVNPAVHDPDRDIAKLRIEEIPQKLDNSEIVEKMMRQTREIKKVVGDDKLIGCNVGAPFTLANQIVGVKEFMTLLGKRSPYVKPLLDYATELCCEITRRYRKNGADLMEMADPCASGDLISPKMFKDVVVPTLDKLYTDLRKEYDVTMIHICGKAGMRLPEIMNLGINGFSVDSMVSIPETMKEAAGKVCMMGNFNPNALLRDGTPAQCYDAAMVNLEAAGLKGGYVLMPGCDLAARTPEDNLRALVKASKDYAEKHS